MKPADRFFVRLSIARHGVDETAPSRVVWGEGRNASSLRGALGMARSLVAELEQEILDREFIAEKIRTEQTVATPRISNLPEDHFKPYVVWPDP